MPLVPLQGGLGLVLPLVWLVVLVVTIAGAWKVFEKAGEPGWAAIIPIYNIYKMTQIGDNEWWWLLVVFVPLIGILAAAKIVIDVAKAFGQGIGFGLGMMFLSFIFWPLLGFGDYQYQGARQPPQQPHGGYEGESA